MPDKYTDEIRAFYEAHRQDDDTKSKHLAHLFAKVGAWIELNIPDSPKKLTALTLLDLASTNAQEAYSQSPRTSESENDRG